MCGICGIVDFERRVELADICRMLELEAHRGPDDAGWLLADTRQGSYRTGRPQESAPEDFSPDLGFGHQRLSIIDLSPAGHQPMCNENGRLWITYNGEVYNYRELAEELKARGHVFSSHTDTEVILHAYEEWGLEAFARFNGMWGFALWDVARQEVVLVRDRFGIKPLYYFYDGRRLIFASEIKCLVELLKPGPNYQAVYVFLTEGLVDGLEDTFFVGVKRLPPGCYARLVLGSRGFEVVRFWDCRPDAELERLAEAEVVEKFRFILEDAVKLRLRSDVPVGTCLSGGLDSSTIFYFAARHYTGGRMNAFTAYFADEGGDFDERRFALQVAEECGGVPHLVNPRAEELFAKLERIIWHLDEPCKAMGVYPQWHVLELAQDKVKVVLDGQGGDELLAGYHTYYEYYVRDFIRSLFKELQLWRLGQLTSEFLPVLRLTRKGLLWEIFTGEFVPESIRRIKRHILPPEDRFSFLAPEFAESYALNEQPPRWSRGELANKLYGDLCRDMLPALLRYEDRIGMAFSLEARVPFLDYRLVELVLGLPDHFKIRRGWTKYVLRRAMDGLLAETVTWRKDKKGFPTPTSVWFRGRLKGEVQELLQSPSFLGRGIFQPRRVGEILERHVSGREDLDWLLWRIITLEVWFRVFFG